ncbi:hypothetical protein BDK51DRAFT_43342 [Blyttiomyces helicus]|uniref:Uncharacterized protein n=1 Tax=Blyttiomyces helicus TaxID=388810 RepID=A0A4P9W434_9FUNG|nr:hypothetical protein BDK51DRAFT_43342 [Blyttiomyces helicus]|eukprot:RKO87101.1 hypothetical protein BDK51DRAFT_43342 [Blyttiomyces helicus]
MSDHRTLIANTLDFAAATLEILRKTPAASDESVFQAAARACAACRREIGLAAPSKAPPRSLQPTAKRARPRCGHSGVQATVGCTPSLRGDRSGGSAADVGRDPHRRALIPVSVVSGAWRSAPKQGFPLCLRPRLQGVEARRDRGALAERQARRCRLDSSCRRDGRMHLPCRQIGLAPIGSHIRVLRLECPLSQTPAFKLLFPIAVNLLPNLRCLSIEIVSNYLMPLSIVAIVFTGCPDLIALRFRGSIGDVEDDFWQTDRIGKSILEGIGRLFSFDFESPAESGDGWSNVNAPGSSD